VQLPQVDAASMAAEEATMPREKEEEEEEHAHAPSWTSFVDQVCVRDMRERVWESESERG
jgi:hypothetical protein